MSYAPRRKPIVRRFRTKKTFAGREIKRTVIERRKLAQERGRDERKARPMRPKVA